MEISNHAAKRLLERAGEFKTDIRPLITPAIAKAMLSLGDGKYPLPGGLKAVVKDQCIVTVIYDTHDHQNAPFLNSPAGQKKRKRRAFPRMPRETWGLD